MDILSFILGRKSAGGGGGGSANLGTLLITENGQYDASDEGYDGYSEVSAEVLNSYTQSDEGKVVSNGALVAQTAHADVTPTTSDQTIDTTLNNSLKVKGDANLVAGNIKKDVVIFNTTGSYEGNGGGITADGMATGSEPNGAITLSTATSIRAYAFNGCSNLTDVTANSVTSVGNYAFQNCAKMGTVNLRALTSAGSNNYIFTSAGQSSNNAIAVLPSITSIGSRMFRFAHFDKIDIGAGVSSIGADSFYTNSSSVVCQTLILRRTEGVVSASSAEAINGLKDVYVPNSLISSYQSASVWSANANITFHKIEDSAYDGYYADGTPIPT